MAGRVEELSNWQRQCALLKSIMLAGKWMGARGKIGVGKWVGLSPSGRGLQLKNTEATRGKEYIYNNQLGEAQTK